MNECSHSPAEISDGDTAEEYKDILKTLFGELALKRHLTTGIHEDFTSEGYYALRDCFRLPFFMLITVDIFNDKDE